MIPRAFLLLFFYINISLADYWTDRQNFIEENDSEMLGSSITLTQKEEEANRILMGYKLKEYDSGFENPGIFSPGRHFFHSRDAIHTSSVFEFILRMPKGAVLHGHDTALVSEEFLYSLTHKENLYACINKGRLKLRFLQHPQQDSSCEWNLLSILRKQTANYESWLRSQLTLNVLSPDQEYQDINAVWKELSEIFLTVEPFITYRPVFEEYFHQALQEIYDDNIMYLEFRSTLPPVYELNGTQYGPVDVAGIYEKVAEEFTKQHPGFLGVRVIYAPMRNVDNETVDNYIEILKQLHEKYPKFLAGFDLVGQEDLGRPLVDFIEQIQRIPKEIDLYFHSAETNWYGTSSDFNLIDAILLGTKRIGHGYGVTKHPMVMEAIKEKQIAVEVCPVSNQVLMLLKDIRNHPAAVLMAQGYPVVISYDDPSYWSTKGLSYDFYMAFMGIASRNSDLKLLKQLALNSLEYSSLGREEKERAVGEWEGKWVQFVEEIVSGVLECNSDCDDGNGAAASGISFVKVASMCLIFIFVI